MGKRKAECTPEEWEQILADGRAAYQKHREKRIERNKAYNKTDVAVARRRAYDMRPDVKARRQERDANHGAAYRKEYWLKIKSDPNLLAEHRSKLRKWRTGVCDGMRDALMVLQDGRCAICHRKFTADKVHRTTKGSTHACADHCHDTGKPRGLLCHNCNAAEGHIRSSGLTPDDYLRRLHDYLRDPPAAKVRR